MREVRQVSIQPLCPDGGHEFRCKLPVGHSSPHLYGTVDAEGHFTDHAELAAADGAAAEVP